VTDPHPPFLREAIPVSFDPVEHVYQDIDTGRYYPGVTRILQAAGKAWMGPWMLRECIGYLEREWKAGEAYTPTARDAILAAAKSAHKRKSTEARDTGTDAHEIIKQIVASRMAGRDVDHDIPKDEGSHSAVKAFLEWEESVKPDYLLSEQAVCCKEWWYAGTLDLAVRVGGMVGLVDVKTSKAIYPEYYAQLAAYQKAVEEWTETPITFRAVLRCPKDGQPFEWAVAPFSFEADLEYFLSCLNIHRWNQAVEERAAKVGER